MKRSSRIETTNRNRILRYMHTGTESLRGAGQYPMVMAATVSEDEPHALSPISGILIPTSP